MLDDLKEYHANTKAQNLRVICLTATAFDGNEEGIELKAIELMSHKLYYNSDKADIMMPQVNETMFL